MLTGVALAVVLGLLAFMQFELRRIRRAIDRIQRVLPPTPAGSALPNGAPYRSLPVISADAPVSTPKLCFECKYFRYQYPASRTDPECIAHPLNSGGFRMDLDDLNKGRDCRHWTLASKEQLTKRWSRY